MLILHVVPVGLSLLDHIELPDSTITAREALAWATGPTQELDWQRLASAGLAPVSVPEDSAAEWTSIAAVMREPRYASAGGEAYVFLATDTDDGVCAATLVAARYQHTTVHYLHEPLAARRRVLEPGDVYLCRIPDLDLGTIKPTSTTWRSLGAAGRLVADTARQAGWQVIVHLSGGYKAMIPYLMVLAEGIHSVLCDVPLGEASPSQIRAVALHESSVRSGKPVVIDVAVRAVRGDLFDDVKELAAATRSGGESVGAGVADDLLGLLIEEASEQTRTLTEAGLIMVNVL
jgi:hypothetical protein